MDREKRSVFKKFDKSDIMFVYLTKEKRFTVKNVRLVKNVCARLCVASRSRGLGGGCAMEREGCNMGGTRR